MSNRVTATECAAIAAQLKAGPFVEIPNSGYYLNDLDMTMRESKFKDANPWCVIPPDESCIKVVTDTGTVTVYRSGRVEVEPHE